jgi:hypothetical protein
MSEKRFSFAVEGTDITISVVSNNESDARHLAFGCLSDAVQNNAQCLDCIDVENA